jgi:hypothetical protein
VGVSPPVDVTVAAGPGTDPVERALHAIRALEHYVQHTWNPDRERVEGILRGVAELLEEAREPKR